MRDRLDFCWSEGPWSSFALWGSARGSLPKDCVAGSGVHAHPLRSPWGLSAPLGMRRSEAQLEQKGQGHLTHRAGGQATRSPPARPGEILGLGQEAKRPEPPQGGRHQLNPDLDARLGPRPEELTTHQSQVAFLKPQAVFDAEAGGIQRLSVVQAGSGTVPDIDQPERTCVAAGAVGSGLDDPVQDQGLLRPQAHADIPPAGDVKAASILSGNVLARLRLRQRARIAELDLAAPHARPTFARVSGRWQEKDAAGTDAAQQIDPLLLQGAQRGGIGVGCIDEQQFIGVPSVVLDKLHHLLSAKLGGRARDRDQGHFQGHVPAAGGHPLTQHREAVSGFHSIDAVHIPARDGFRLGSVIVGGIQDAHPPRPQSRIVLTNLLVPVSQPLDSSPPQSRHRLFFGPPAKGGVQTRPLIAPEGADDQLEGAADPRSHRQGIHEIHQHVTAARKRFSHPVTQIAYNMFRGTDRHSTSRIPLDACLGGRDFTSPTFFFLTV